MKKAAARTAGSGPTFRSIEEWKSALMTLPDSNFFELLRSVFGSIKTPFNKQRLMDDLMVLLSRDEIRKTIGDYIDDADRKVIAAVALLREPAPGELESFFSGELSYAELHNILLNLEERLIIYRFQDSGMRRLALNPALEPVLEPIAADREILFPSTPENLQPASHSRKEPAETSYTGTACIRDARALAGLLAFITSGVSGDDGFFKAEGGVRKKFIAGGKKLFPGLDMEIAAGALVQLGLLHADGERPVPDEGRIGDFSRLSAAETREYWAAAVYLALNKEGHGDSETAGVSHEYTSGYSSGHSRGRLKVIAAFIHRFCDFLEPKHCYPKITLKRFAELLNHEEDSGGWGYRLVESPVQLPFDPLLECLEKTGLLQEVNIPGEAGIFRRAGVFPVLEAQEDKAVIAMNSAFSFVLYPEISFTDAAALSTFCNVNGIWGTGFELTRISAVRGFDRGIESAYMLELLNRLSAGRVDVNLGWTLKDWESRYSSVSLYEGIILTLAEDRRYLAEAGPVASLIKQILAPGVYLLGDDGNSDVKTEAALALRKAGVDIIACPGFQNQTHGGAGRSGVSSFRAFPPLDGDAAAAPFTNGSLGTHKTQGLRDNLDSIKEHFRNHLKELRLPKSEHDELSARIERRLVLSDAQLGGASLRYEKLEARGLDYVGKAAIAKQAIAAGALVEVSWPGPDGGINTAVGIPSALEKAGGQSVLVIKPVEQNAAPHSGEQQDGEQQNGAAPHSEAQQSAAPPELRLPLGKISLLRRIKQSIFGEN